MTDRVAIVTGGAGYIGTAICQRLVEDGFAVKAVDIAEPRTRNDAVDFTTADLTSENAVASFMSELHAPVSAVVNCAGISPKSHDGTPPAISEIAAADWEMVFRVNTLLPFLVVKHAYPLMISADNPSIVNVTSIAGKLGVGYADGAGRHPAFDAAAHYCASKAALHNLTISMARELGPMGIRVNAVSPGQIGTGMGSTNPGAVNRMFLPQIPLGRLGDPVNVAAAVSFLTGRDARYITGESIDVDGGWMPD